jgi:hypothetical protein
MIASICNACACMPDHCMHARPHKAPSLAPVPVTAPPVHLRVHRRRCSTCSAAARPAPQFPSSYTFIVWCKHSLCKQLLSPHSIAVANCTSWPTTTCQPCHIQMCNSKKAHLCLLLHTHAPYHPNRLQTCAPLPASVCGLEEAQALYTSQPSRLKSAAQLVHSQLQACAALPAARQSCTQKTSSYKQFFHSACVRQKVRKRTPSKHALMHLHTLQP